MKLFRLLVGVITFIAVYNLPFFQSLPHYLFFNLVSLAEKNTANNSNIFLEEKPSINDVKLIKLGVPPFRVDAPQNVITKPSAVERKLLSETPNQITDDQAWFERNNLSLPTYQVPNNFSNTPGNIPDRIFPVFNNNINNNILVSAIRQSDRDFLIYGDDFGDGKYLFIYDLKQQKFTLGYDFSNYLLSPNYPSSD